MGCVYQIEFPNGKSYIGITRATAERRLAVHSYRRNHAGYAICNAIRKYGREAMKVKTLAIGKWEYLAYLEPRAIAAFGTKVPNGYNMTDGGEAPVGLPPESLARIGAAAKRNTYNVGKKRTEDTRAKMSAAAKGNTKNRGRKHRPEVVEAMRLRSSGRKQSEETILKRADALRGQTRTPEQRARISAAALLREAAKRQDLTQREGK